MRPLGILQDMGVRRRLKWPLTPNEYYMQLVVVVVGVLHYYLYIFPARCALHSLHSDISRTYQQALDRTNKVTNASTVQDLKSSMPFKLTRRGPSNYNTSLKTTLQNATPKLQNEDVAWSLQGNLSTTRTNMVCSSIISVQNEVFNALQMRFGPSKYNTSFKTTLQNATPNCKMMASLEVLNIICPPQEPT